MSNMSYCRFQNTATDLEDCLDEITNELSKDEHRARTRLIRLCRDIVNYADSESIPENPKGENNNENDDSCPF